VETYFLAHEASIRLYGLIVAFGAIAFWESIQPRRALSHPLRKRWFINIGLTVAGSFLVAWLFPVVAVSSAIIASEQTWSLLNLVNLPFWSESILALLFLDLTRYLQNRLLHTVPFLW
jgi:sterol desaturase/sphingolipid hydroxylase (fatty acid hydroxylase superfamily)